MSDVKVNFKGVDDGIAIEVEKGNLLEVKEFIEEKIGKNRNFYKGASISGIYSDELALREKFEILFLLKYKYQFDIKEKAFDAIENIPIVEGNEEVKELGTMTKIVNRTIRSGQSINYDGSVVVIGDVNPGAEIEATGSIIVLGAFRGVGYAGKEGDQDAIVASYKLFPTQLRIADKIARSSDKHPEEKFTGLPEIAKVVGEKLVIEPYLPNK